MATLTVGASLVCAAPSWATGTPAGSEIVNVATATFTDEDGRWVSLTSNEARVRVGEVLDVVVAQRDPGPVGVAVPDVDRALAFTVTNTGNGRERFGLAALTTLGGDAFDPALRRIVLDADGDGVYTPAVDRDYAPGVDPEFAPDQSLTVFVVGDVPADLTNGALGLVRLIATAATGHGPSGTAFAGLGDGGGEAVSGRTTARASAEGAYIAALAQLRLVKSQAVRDAAGGTEPEPGAIVTYTLRADVSGDGAVDAARLSDAVPAGTTYLPGSLTLDGSALTDAADADAGAVLQNTLRVSLGRLTAPASHAVTFQVRLDDPGA